MNIIQWTPAPPDASLKAAKDQHLAAFFISKSRTLLHKECQQVTLTTKIKRGNNCGLRSPKMTFLMKCSPKQGCTYAY